jgi:hypothetical protein
LTKRMKTEGMRCPLLPEHGGMEDPREKEWDKGGTLLLAWTGSPLPGLHGDQDSEGGRMALAIRWRSRVPLNTSQAGPVNQTSR